MTLAEAKMICKQVNGRLPRMGCKMLVQELGQVKVWLVNESGRFRVRIHESV